MGHLVMPTTATAGRVRIVTTVITDTIE
jgi:hypothetical protein